jgi:hypothetical protein
VGALAFAWLLWVPTLRGLALGNRPEDIFRDVVPLVFLFLPLMLGRVVRGRVLAAGMAAVAVAFALRWLWGVLPLGVGARQVVAWDSRYLVNGPAVSFAAVWLPLVALRCPPGGARGMAAALAQAAAGAVALAALVLAVHRTAAGLALAALVVGACWSGRRSPWPFAGALAATVAALLLGSEPLAELLGAFADKTRIHGFNGRVAEFDAVLDRAAEGWGALLLGSGWGGLIRNPAVGEWWVSYTHGFPGYVLFKTGLLGLLAAAAWVAVLGAGLVRLLRRDVALGIALVPPFATGLLAHMSFKCLCFGLLTTLCVPSAREDDAGRSCMR